MPVLRWILDSEIRNLKALLAESEIRIDRVVDVGVGAGDSWTLFPQNVSGIGVDASHKMLMRTRARFPALDLVSADASALPFRGETVPFLSLIGVAEYIPNKKQLLRECARVVIPKGHSLVTLPAPGLLTLLRNLLGARLFSVNRAEWEIHIKETGWQVLGFRKTLLQRQVLLQKKGGDNFPVFVNKETGDLIGEQDMAQNERKG